MFRDGHHNISFFTGTEVEHTPAFGLNPEIFSFANSDVVLDKMELFEFKTLVEPEFSNFWTSCLADSKSSTLSAVIRIFPPPLSIVSVGFSVAKSIGLFGFWGLIAGTFGVLIGSGLFVGIGAGKGFCKIELVVGKGSGAKFGVTRVTGLF